MSEEVVKGLKLKGKDRQRQKTSIGMALHKVGRFDEKENIES